MTGKEFEKLTENHGEWASWAVWEYSKIRAIEKSTSIIKESLAELHNRYVLIGLNISNPVEIWGNFRGGKHDRKLKYAFNDSAIRGAYMTDLFRIEMKESIGLAQFLRSKPEIIKENINRFNAEMSDLGINDNTVFVIFGTEESVLARFYKDEFQKYYKKNPVIYHRHYSSRGTDKEWVESMWKSLNVKDNYENTLARYKI